ncbi:CID (CTD-interacting domain) domain protein [Ceratobasidium sp. AG-Ba]|nr:CID (CTD-interacting domain) domain protein [Ceratobasidium sp. AG-Ba]
MFNAQLATLTFNSKAIIQHLGYISKMYADSPMVPVIAESIERHIQRVPAAIKLPPFYLLDSIAKNIGHPYIPYFTHFIVRLFLDTYHLVDAPTRGKMEEMLVTWRTAHADGDSVAGPSKQNRPNVNQVLLELDVTLSSKERLLAVNPSDQDTASQIQVLIQLRSLVQSRTASDEELSAILTQLRSLAKTTAASAPPPPPQPQPPAPAPVPTPVPAPQYSYPPQAQAQSQPTFYRQPPSHNSTPSHAAPAPSFDLAALLRAASSSTPTPNSSQQNSQPAPAPTPTPTVAPPSSVLPSELLKNLISAGLLTLPTTDQVSAATPVKQEESVSVGGGNDYDDMIMAIDVQLNAASIQRERPQMANILYNRLPLQCKQCAMRFPAGDAGKKSMEDHLDLHFRQNRKASQNTGRGHSRSWFITRNDWIHGARDAGESTTTVKAQAAAAAEHQAKLRDSFVIIPPGEEAKAAVCPICKESIKSEYLEDEEEWVWRNALRVKDQVRRSRSALSSTQLNVPVSTQVYHATCHDEAGQATSLVSRLRSEMGAVGGATRSRSLTPERLLPASPRSPGSVGKVAGIKRKAEDEVAIKVEPGSLLPKRVAL